MPDFATLKPVNEQPDFTTLKPVTPSIPQTLPSTIDNLLSPAKQAVSGLATLYGGTDEGIAKKIVNDIQSGATDIEKGGFGNLVKGTTKAGFRTAGDVAGAIFAPVGAALQATGINNVFDYLGQLSQKGGNYNPINLITDSQQIQKFVMSHPNLEEDFGRALNLGLSAAEKGNIDPKTIVDRTLTQFKKIPGNVQNTINTITNKAPEKVISNRVAELKKVSDNYASLRKQADFNPKTMDESVKRVASTDVLSDSVDENGLIRTKQPGGAVDQYKAQTIDHAEGVVRKNLVRLGESVSPEEIKVRLEDSVKNSGLEGADLNVALKKVDREIEGLKLRANPQGEIPLEIIQDAKVSKYANTDFFTPAEKQVYNKSIGKGYKEIIEKNSSFNVKEVNGELSKYLKDIEFLQSLDGKRVKGSKLGKYFAKISGNIVGGLAGSFIGGPLGGAAGSIAGGELAGRIQSSALEKTFSGKTGYTSPPNPIIDNAVKTADQSNNLGNRQPQYQNVTPANNSLTNIDKSLPQKNNIIKTAAEKYKNLPNKEGGFVKIGGKEFREVADATKREMIKIIDYLNLKKETDKDIEYSISKILPKYNINQDWSNNKIADTLELLIERTKTN